jgi:hypothetical protein
MRMSVHKNTRTNTHTRMAYSRENKYEYKYSINYLLRMSPSRLTSAKFPSDKVVVSKSIHLLHKRHTNLSFSSIRFSNRIQLAMNWSENNIIISMRGHSQGMKRRCENRGRKRRRKKYYYSNEVLFFIISDCYFILCCLIPYHPLSPQQYYFLPVSESI